MKRIVEVLLLCLVAVATAGCATQAEQEFTAVDVETTASYINMVQPVVESYAAQSGNAQLIVDSRLLAEKLHRNGQTRLDALKAEEQAVASARAAVNALGTFLVEYHSSMEASSNVETRPATD